MRRVPFVLALAGALAGGAMPASAQMPPASAQAATQANADLIRRLEERVGSNASVLSRLQDEIEDLQERLGRPVEPQPHPPPPAFQSYDTLRAQVERINQLRSTLEWQRRLIVRMTARRDALRRRLR